MRGSHPDGELHRLACKCAVEHSFEHNPDMERIKLDTVDHRNLQHIGKHYAVPFQM